MQKITVTDEKAGEEMLETDNSVNFHIPAPGECSEETWAILSSASYQFCCQRGVNPKTKLTAQLSGEDVAPTG